VASVWMLGIGGCLTLYTLWQVRRALRSLEEARMAGPVRLQEIMDELVASAELASQVVEEKSEELIRLISMADDRLLRLGKTATTPAGVEQLPEDLRQPELEQPQVVNERHRLVLDLANRGSDVTGIARELNITKGEVQLILGIHR
jgi:DNA-binding NarL/FixJ family response regulator